MDPEELSRLETRDRNRAMIKLLSDAQDRFDEAIKTGVETPWWKEFINVIKDRREALQDMLSNPETELSQRQEDRLIGQIAALAFIVNLDTIGNAKKDVAERKDPNAPAITF